MEHPLIRRRCLHDDLRDLSNLWEGVFHHLHSAFSWTRSVAKELHFNVLEAVLPLAIAGLDVLYDGLVEVPDQLPREAPHVVKHLETQEVSYFAFVHGKLQLQDVEVAQHEQIQGQAVVLHRHAVQAREELLRGAEGFLPVEPVGDTECSPNIASTLQWAS